MSDQHRSTTDPASDRSRSTVESTAESQEQAAEPATDSSRSAAESLRLAATTAPGQPPDGTLAGADSRRGRFPSLSVSLSIARIEQRRARRRIREQDVWLAVLALGALGVLVALPVLFGVARDFGREIAAGDAEPASMIVAIVVGLWLFNAALATVSGVGSDGAVDEPAALLTVRPHRDVAGGLLLSSIAWYAPFVLLPVTVGFVGLAVGVGTPAPIVGGVLAGTILAVTAVAGGYPVGLLLKGVIRRSAYLERLKPLFGGVAVVGYVWLVVSGRLTTIIEDAGSTLAASPLGWLGDLALVTTPGAGASPTRAAGAVVVAVGFAAACVLATVRAAEYAWYVDRALDEDDATPAETTDAGRGIDRRLDAALGAVGVTPATRGIATTALVRAYRRPLQLAYVAVPLLFALPAFERFLATGVVPEYAPWVVVLYGAWAAGAAFPLNLLGNQGVMLPALVASRANGRRIVHGHVLAAVLPIAPLTVAVAVAVGRPAGWTTPERLVIAVVAPIVVTAGAVLAAGVGACFPRFESIDVTGSSEARLPAKSAFALFSVFVTLSVTAVGVLADDLYRTVVSRLLADYSPYGTTVTPSALTTGAWIAAAVVLVAIPVAYTVAVRRTDGYRLS